MSDFRATFDLANNTPLTGANTGYSTATGTRTQVADTTIKHVGTASAKITGTGLTTWTQAFTANVSTHYRRVYIRPDSLPSVGTRIWAWRDATDTADMGDIRITTAGEVQIRNSALTSVAISTTTLTVGQWYRIEARVTGGTTTVRIFGGAKLDNVVTDYTEQISGAYTAGPMSGWRSGAGTSSTWNLHLDDERGSDSAWPSTAFPPAPGGGTMSAVGGFGTAPYTGVLTSVTADLPATIQANDTALVIASTNAPARTLTTPNGWTLLAQAPDIVNNKRSYLLKRYCTDADAGSTLTTVWSGSAHSTIAGVVIRGADPDIDGWVSASSTFPVNNTSFTTPAWTPHVANAMGVCLVSGSAGTAIALNVPGAFTEDWDSVSQTSLFITGESMHRQLTGGSGVVQPALTGTWTGPVTCYQVFVVSLGVQGTVSPPVGRQYRYRYHDGVWEPQEQ